MGCTPSPEIVVLGPPSVFRKYDAQFSSKFRILRTWESPLTLAQFLKTHAQKTEAALVAAYSSVSADVMDNMPSLRLIVTTSAGIDHIDLAECRRRGVAIANASTIFSADVADLAVGLLLDVLRRISVGNRFVKSGLWPLRGAYPLGLKFGGKKAGIVGLGSIGLEVAKRLESFGCTISYLSRNKKLSSPYAFYSDVLSLASNSDFLVLCCALNEETQHMINREVLLALGKQGVVVNVARGAVIDEKDLVICLQRGEIGGAGLDVFEKEPCFSSELFELDNVVMSPHVAVFTDGAFRDLFELICGNFDNFFSNKPLLTPVSEY